MQIRSVTIVVPDPQATAAFFEQSLDLPATPHEDNLEIRLGTSTLVLQQGKADSGGYYHLAFDITENRIDEARGLLRQRTDILPAGDDGIVTASPSWDAHSLYFNAPGNLNLELIARHRLPNAISTDFAFTDIQNISEVGIPVTNPIDAVTSLQHTFGLAPFGEPSETFAPVGSDTGLLILVKSGRIWFPTNDQATTNRPLKIGLSGVDGSLTLGEHCTIIGV
ncbi:MAG TPA: VOC family protein [Thermomicrobiales bacterium]|nr:VOC family protein [Thermomicrobiales bacterium]